MGYRLLVDLEVIAALDALPRKTRTRLMAHFHKLRAAPDGIPTITSRIVSDAGWKSA